MTEINTYLSGRFCWIDLATTDAQDAKKFYAGLFGWRFHEISVGSGAFTMCQLDGKAVSSLYQLSKQHQTQGVPAHWIPYVAVANIDETAAAVTAFGGQLLVDPFDVMDLGCMALALDPTAAPFALWQAGRHIGSELANRPGTLAWTELITGDIIQAGHFYSQLFGWDLQTHEGEIIFSSGDQPIAGIRQLTDAGGDRWPQWRVCFAVADCQVSAAHTRALGGEVIMSRTNTSLFRRSVLIQDSQGAVLSIIEPTTLLSGSQALRRQTETLTRS